MAKGYCVRCKVAVDIRCPEQVRLKNGRDAVQGTCPHCGTKIFKMGKLGDDVNEDLNEYNGWQIVNCKDAHSYWYEGRYDDKGVRVTISRGDLRQLKQVIDSTEVLHTSYTHMKDQGS
jgi:DNA-directed RNA polymerase subunit RPC12/RpoP